MNKIKPIKSYACLAKDEDIRLNGSSGGIFQILAEHVLSLGGVIYGTAMSDDCRTAEIIKVNNKIDLKRLLGSKYIQSKNVGIFKDIANQLQNGNYVLFSGTPCQVQGLKLFLGKDYSNLVCIDVICHGTPSPKLWTKYVDFIEKKYDGSLTSINFRCKDQKWDYYGILESPEFKKIYVDKQIDLYMQLFLKNYSLRPSCYHCKGKEYSSDITLGDFWGVEKAIPHLDSVKGVSIVLTRSDKGNEIFSAVSSNLEYFEIKYEDAIRNNPAEYKSVEYPAERNSFYKDLDHMSFKMLCSKYLYPKPKHKIKRLLIDMGIWKHIDTLRKGNNNRSNSKYGLLFTIKKNDY